MTFAFVGGGFAGLVTARGWWRPASTDVRIVEKGGDFGGTWYWNRYPGAQCDTASMVYMPLLEETGHVPSEKYAHAPEILAQCQRIGRQFGLYDNALFHTEVEGVDWNAAGHRWVITTNRGDRFTAQFIGLGTGPLHVPKLPGIPGIETFKGHAFHTSRWDYDYTGGDPNGAPLDRLADKRVAIIGTGATAVQCVPHLAGARQQLYVIQRTPSSVDVRANTPIDPDWFASIATPGWQQRWLENFTQNQAGGTADEDLVQDGWTDLSAASAPACDDSAGADEPRGHVGRLRGLRLREDGGDPRPRRGGREGPGHGAEAEGLVPAALQAALLPRRISAGLQPAAHPAGGHRRAGRRGDHRDGRGGGGVEYEVDCIIYASGFEVGTGYTRRAGFDVVGRDGLKISEAWADGMRSKHGMHVHGFPNLFFVQPTQGANLISNVPHNLTEAGKTIAGIVGKRRRAAARRWR